MAAGLQSLLGQRHRSRVHHRQDEAEYPSYSQHAYVSLGIPWAKYESGGLAELSSVYLFSWHFVSLLLGTVIAKVLYSFALMWPLYIDLLRMQQNRALAWIRVVLSSCQRCLLPTYAADAAEALLLDTVKVWFCCALPTFRLHKNNSDWSSSGLRWKYPPYGKVLRVSVKGKCSIIRSYDYYSNLERQARDVSTDIDGLEYCTSAVTHMCAWHMY